MRQFAKPALPAEQHMRLLTSRGLTIRDEAECARALNYIGYYRLTGYMLPFQIGGGVVNKHDFKPNTDFSDVLALYDFDRKLRSLMLDALERIEIALRVVTSDMMASTHGPHWYMAPESFTPGFRHDRYLEVLKVEVGHDDATKRSVFNQHYYNSYASPEMPPCWMAFEVFSFGKLALTVRNLKKADRARIARQLNLGEPILHSWCLSLSNARNHCAHHERVWNRSFTIRPMISSQYERAMTPNHTCYVQLVTMQILMKVISPASRWHERVRDLLVAHPYVAAESMGFPPGWFARPPWS